MINKMPRRDSLKILVKSGLMLPFTNMLPFGKIADIEKQNSAGIHVFGKHLQWLNYKKMAQTAAEIGFDGVDITVRPKGQVLPENVETDLPKAVEALHKAGLKADLITTAIVHAKDIHTEKIIKTASQLGIKYYRMGWLDYNEKTPIPQQLETYRIQLEHLAEMNEKYNIHGAYQNHAGTSVGAPVWDIWHLIKDINPQWLGCRYDVRHATVEGFNSWELGLKLLEPHIKSLDIKDFDWEKDNEAWTAKTVPLGSGTVNFQRYFQLLDELDIKAPITMHFEYPLGGADKGAYQLDIPEKELKAALKKDLVELKRMIKVSQH